MDENRLTIDSKDLILVLNVQNAETCKRIKKFELIDDVIFSQIKFYYTRGIRVIKMIVVIFSSQKNRKIIQGYYMDISRDFYYDKII